MPYCLINIAIFLILSVVVMIISRDSLRAPGSHGFYRFFAWEFILALAVINLNVWFVDPFSWHQIISWILLIGSIIPLAFGVRSLISRGKPVKTRDGEPQLLAFEKTSQLVTSGIYHYIRHPLYSSLLLLTWGIFFKSITLPGVALSLAATFALILTARADEAECIRFFGDDYIAYMRTSKRFIPFLF